jgi:hypothetical protein
VVSDGAHLFLLLLIPSRLMTHTVDLAFVRVLASQQFSNAALVQRKTNVRPSLFVPLTMLSSLLLSLVQDPDRVGC